MDEQFREYVAARTESLRFTAYLLTGDWHLAEDIVQTSLVKLYRVWHRIERGGSIDAYVRRIITRTFLNERRRAWWRREHVTDAPPEPAPPPASGPEDRMLVWAALKRVPRKQRAALVLRYWEDLSLAEAAEVLGCSEGTVKSQCSRGLRTLREVLERDAVVGR